MAPRFLHRGFFELQTDRRARDQANAPAVVGRWVLRTNVTGKQVTWPDRRYTHAQTQRRTASQTPEGGQSHQQIAASLGISKGVTLMLLWEECCAQVGDEHTPERPVRPWRYAQFCENHRQFAKRLKRSMRQVHRADEKLFIESR